MFLRLGPRVRRYLAGFFRVYSTWHFLTAYPAKHVTLGAEKSLVRKLCNGIYVVNSPNMQCLQILGNKTFSCLWRPGQKQVPVGGTLMPGGWEPGPRPQSVSPSQATLWLPTGFVQQGLCHRVYVTVCASCHLGSRSDLLTYLDSVHIP